MDSMDIESSNFRTGLKFPNSPSPNRTTYETARESGKTLNLF